MDVPTKLPMTLSNVCYVSSARTTVCDIMCTINTYQQIEKSSVPINLRSLVATLPYEKNKAGFRKGKTKFEDHKISEVKMRLIEELKRDRDDFFHKLKREKQEKDRIRGKAATKIQAIYRGYRQRPRPTPYVRRRKPVVSLLQYEVQDELCKMSTALNLKPIAGLNLEPRSKTSKRRRKIETAAAFRIQRLFQMITARNKARLVVDQKKVERIHRSAVVITNSFRYLKTKNFIKSYETMRRNQMVIKLQCQIRYFQAVAKVRKLRALKLKSDRVNSAAVIVQRSMKTRFLKGEISVDRAIAIKAHQVRHKSMDLVYGFLSAITDTVIEEEIEETIDLAAPEWLERKMKEAEEEAVRLSLERTMFELEITNMFGEDILEIAHAEETKRETVESGQMALEDCLDGTEEDSLFNTDQSIVDGDSTIPYDEELGFSDSVVDFISKAMSKTMMKLSRDPYDETENFAIPDEGSKKFVEEVIFSALRSVYKDKSSLAATFYVSQAIEEAINKSTGNVIALNRISEIEYIARKVSGIVVAEVLQNKIFQQKMITPEGEELLEAEVTQEVSPPKSEDLPDPTAIEDNVLDAVDRKVIIDIEEELHSASVDESEDPPVLTKDDALSLGMTEIEFEDFNAVYNDSRKAFSDAKYRQSIERATKCESMLKRFSTKIREKNEFVKIETAVWLMLGNAYFAIANYNESQRFLEDAFNSRSATFGSRHVLVAEAALYYAEWHRSQARYNEAETFYFQAKAAIDSEVLSVKEPKIDDFVVRNLYMKILICYTELFKNCGQYFKANKMMGEAQRVVRENKEIGIRHVENECDFIMTLISITTIKGKYSQTIPLHEELLTLLRRKYGKSAHPKLATALTNYGALKLLMCNYVEASTLIEEGLVVRLMFFRAEHPAVASSLFFKATHFMKVGKYQPAYTEMMESLEYRSKVLGNDHPSVAQSLTGLAMISTLIGNGLKAVDGLVKALSIEKQSFGTEMHRQIAGTVFNLGNNAESRGNYVEAERFYLKASELRENLVPLYGGEMGFNLDVEVTKVYLAHIYSLQSRMDEAKTMLKDPIKIIRRILGNNNTIVAQCFLYLGDFCSLRGDYQDAVTLYSLSFDTFSKLLGDRHPSIADVMLQSSNNFRLIGRFKESFELISACLRIRIEVFGEQSLKVAEGYHGQGRIYRDKGKYRDAEKFYLKALNIYISKRVESGAQYACALADSAECYRLLGRYDVAEQSFSKAIAMLNLCYGENSLVLNEALCNFAILLMDMKHFKHSAKILKGKVIPLFKAALGETHPWFLYATANYTFCNDSMNKYQNSTVSLSSSHSVDSDLGDQSIGESVRIPLDKHSEIIKLLDFFHSSTYSEEHPWVARFLDIFNMNHSSAASDTDERSLESSKYDSLDDSYDSSSVRRDLNSVDGDDDYSYSSYTRDSRTELSRMDSGIESQYNDDDSRRSPAGLSHRENSLSSAISDYISVGDESSVDSWEQTKDTYSIDYLTNSQSGSIISKSVNTYQYTPTSASSETDDYYDFTPSTDRKSYISTDSYSRDMKSQSSYTSSPPYSYSTGSRTPIDGNSLSTYDNSNADSPYRSVSSYQQSSSFIDDNREGGSSVDSRDSRSGTSYDPSLDNSADHTYSSVDKSSYKSGNSNSRYSLESSTIRSSHYKAGAKSVSSADRDESVPFVSSRTSAVENDTDNRSYSSNHDVSGTVRNSSFESSSLVESSDLDHSSSKGYLDKSKSLVEPSSSTLDPKTATGSIYLESSGQDDGSTYDSYVDDDRSYESHSHDPRSHADSRSYADESVDRSYNDDSQTVDSHTYDRSKKDHGRSSYREDSQTTLDESSKTKGKSDVPTKAPTEDEDDDYEEDYEEDYEDEDFDSVSNER